MSEELIGSDTAVNNDTPTEMTPSPATPAIDDSMRLAQSASDFVEQTKEAPIPSETTSQVTELQEKGKFQEIFEFLRDLVIILVLVIGVRTYVASPFQISGSSMEDSYHDKEFIIVDKFSYANLPLYTMGDPIRGDVVILQPHANNGKEYYIKRVVGIPGDSIKFEAGDVYVKTATSKDFRKLDEAYLSDINKGKTFLPIDAKEFEFTVPEGTYFVMGDNRNNSSDSRSCFLSCSIEGSSRFLKREYVVGKVFLNLGYINLFEKGSNLSFKYPPRLLDTPRTWNYEELQYK